MIASFVVNYRCAPLTARAAASVLADCPSAEVVVVDNSECAMEAQRLRAALPSQVRVITAPENLGFGAANELALAASSGDPILLLNPDASVMAGCVARLAATLRDRPGIGAVAPMIWSDRHGGFALPPGQMESPAWELWCQVSRSWGGLGAISSLAFRAGALKVWTAREPVTVAMLSGGVVMISRAAVGKAGGLFDPRFFVFYEDTDLSRRLRAAGLSLAIDPRAHAIHRWRADPHKNLLMADGRRSYLDKHFRGSMTLRLVERMRLGASSKEGWTVLNLGQIGRPPVLTVPSSWQRRWLFEVSPNPTLIPALGLLGTGPEVRLEQAWWDNLAAGRYFARLAPARGWFLHPQYFSWEVPPADGIGHDGRDALSLVAATHQAPLGATVSLQGLSPPPSLALMERFGFEPEPGNAGRCVKRRQPTWRVAWARHEDGPALRELFRAAFGREMPVELWHWKYGRDRQRFGIAVWRGERAAAYYGALPRRLYFFGVAVEAVQSCDVMTHPEERGMLSRAGPFFSAALTFAECCLGPPPRCPFAFGFPSARHQRLGVKLGIHHEVTRIVELSWPCNDSGRSLWWKTRPLGRGVRDAMVADRLWREMARSLAYHVVGERAASYLRRRFLDHPLTTYAVLLVRQRWTMRPWGIVVLRDQGSWVELVDLVGPPGRMATLVAAARRYAGNLGRTELRGWITEEFAHALKSEDARAAATEITVPMVGTASTLAPALAKRSRGRWFLMAGDTDFH